MKYDVLFVFIVLIAAVLWTEIYLDTYSKDAMPYGKIDIHRYILNRVEYSKILDVHSLYVNLTYWLSQTLGMQYPFFLTLFVPITGTLLLGEVLLSSYSMLAETDRFLACIGLFCGTYLMFVNNTVCVLAQFMSLLFFYLSMPYVVDRKFFDKRFLAYALISVLFHKYTLLFYILAYSMGIRRWYLVLLLLPMAAILLRPQDLIEFTFFSDYYNETSPYEHLFYFINPYLLSVSILSALSLKDSYLKKLYWSFFSVGMVSHISRALPFFFWIMAYVMFKGDFKVSKAVWWLIVLTSLIWFDHTAWLFAQSYVGFLDQLIRSGGIENFRF